ncbi:MAG: hypothetical protein IJA75_07325 [Oscillospiraceae bacterium]|nr:hypothetical protein [Oscillospiraceae bacterium]
MKKALIILLTLMLLLAAGCGKEAPEGTTAPDPTTEPVVETTEATQPQPTETEPVETEPPVPETTSATVQADKTGLILSIVNRGDTVEVVGEFDEDHYAVKLETGYGLVQKRLVRLEGEEPYVGWEGYARYNAMLYPSYILRTAEGTTLNMNTRVQVLEDLGDVLLVQWEQTLGFMEESMVSTTYIKPATGGGSADGGDIVLGYRGGVTNLSTFVPQEGEVSGKAEVLADGTEILLGWFDRDEEVQIVAEEGFAEGWEGYHTIYLKGLYGYIREGFLLEEGAEAYEQWTGYAKYGAKLYAGFTLSGEAVTLGSNEAVTILWDLGDCYLAERGDVTGYVPKDSISETPIVYGGGGGGGGEWTPPAM